MYFRLMSSSKGLQTLPSFKLGYSYWGRKRFQGVQFPACGPGLWRYGPCRRTAAHDGAGERPELQKLQPVQKGRPAFPWAHSPQLPTQDRGARRRASRCCAWRRGSLRRSAGQWRTLGKFSGGFSPAASPHPAASPLRCSPLHGVSRL